MVWVNQLMVEVLSVDMECKQIALTAKIGKAQEAQVSSNKTGQTYKKEAARQTPKLIFNIKSILITLRCFYECDFRNDNRCRQSNS